MNQPTSRHRDPPVLLSIALALTAIKALAYLGVGLLAGLVMAGVLTAGSLPLAATGRPDALIGFGAVGILGVGLIGLFLLLQVFKLYVCLKAWTLSRTWLIVLLVITLISILAELPSDPSCCFLPLVVDLMLVVGAVQALSFGPAELPGDPRDPAIRPPNHPGDAREPE